MRQSRAIGAIHRNHRADDPRDGQPDWNVDEEQPVPRKLLGHESAHVGPDRRREHGDGAGDQDRARMQRFRKHLVSGSKDCRDHRAGEEPLQRAPHDQRHVVVRETAREARQREAQRGAGEQPARRERSREPAAQRDGDHLGDQVRRLNPAQLIERRVQRGRNARKCCRDDLDIEDRHEEANAHRGKAEPQSAIVVHKAHPKRFTLTATQVLGHRRSSEFLQQLPGDRDREHHER